MLMKLILNARKITYVILFALITTQINYAQVGIGTTTPDDSAALDIDTDNAGFLMPRVSLTGTNDTSTISGSEEVGLLVYNTANTGSGSTEVHPGFYYWNGSQWVGDLITPSTTSSEDDWTTLGNAGTNPSVNFIGTTDNEDLVFKTNNDEQMRIMANGYVGINTTSAEEYLDVNGDIDFGGGSSDWDADGENLHIRARSEDWFIAATNATSQAESSFYISTGQQYENAQFRIENNGYVNIGSDNEFEARDMLHVTNDDENETTVIRIDNTRNSNSIFHTALELWDGSTEGSGMKAFFRHNNRDNILEIGQAHDDGTVHFYSGDSTGSSSAITMTLDNSNHVGIGTSTPDDSAALDIDTDDAGFLMPRVSLSSTSDTSTISGSEATGLLVYNTATVSDVTPGFYYWDGSQWVAISSGGSSDDGSENAWLLTGNSGTDDSINYIGTNDQEDVVFSADGNEYMRLSWDTGFFGINTTAAQEYLDVNGDIDMGGGPSDYDSDGENIKFRARSDDWFVAATNASSEAASSFYIGTTQDWRRAQLLITNDGKVNIGEDDSDEPDDMLHITKDQDESTTIRIDNTNSSSSSNGTIHQSLELWDGSGSSGEMAFFRHLNRENRLEIGHARGNGSIEFYSGNGGSSSGDSEIAMVIDDSGNVGIGNDDTTPDDILHITKDQNDTTAIRIDNTNNGGNTGLELWDGSDPDGRMAYFIHNNSSDFVAIGHARGNGEVRFRSGNGGSSSDNSSDAMILENDGHVTIETVMNLKPGSAPSSPERGDIYYDSSTNKVRVYTGSSWENLN